MYVTSVVTQMPEMRILNLLQYSRDVPSPPLLALARLLRKFFQNLRYGRERPKVARKLRSLAGGWAPLYGRAAAEEIFSEVI